MANSEPVVIASDQSAITVTATNLDVQSGGADLATSTQAGAIQTSVELMDDTVTAQGTALGTTKTILNGASVTTAAPTYTTGQISPLNLATTGALRVDVGATSANATAIKVNVGSGGIASGGIASGAIASGAVASGAIASGAIASGAIATGAIAAGTASIAQLEDVAHSPAEHLLKSGVRRIDTAASSSGTSGDWSTMDASAEGALWVTQTPTTTSGVTIHKTDALVATAVAVKASAGNIYGYHIYNPNATDIYVHVYNIAQGSTTVGTSSRTISMVVPAYGVLDAVFPMPLSFGTAITIAATTTLTGNTAPGTGLVTNIYYK